MTAQNFIAGQRIGTGSIRLQSLDASTGEALPREFLQATEAEVDAAARAAEAAFPAYNALPAERRAQFLDAIASELEALGDDFIATVCRETALPAARIQGERGRTANQMRLFAKVLRRATSSARASTAPCRSASRCHARTCASTAPASARWPCSAPATFRWPSPPPVATPLPRWPPAAPSW